MVVKKPPSLQKLVNLWEPLINFPMFKSQMTYCNSKRQADIAKEILERFALFESKVLHLSDISKTVNLPNLELPGRGSDLLT